MQVELVNSTSCLKLSFSRLGRDNGDLGRENHDFMYLHYFLRLWSKLHPKNGPNLAKEAGQIKNQNWGELIK